MSEKPVIGFIGLGFMGHGMAKNILNAGYSLAVRGGRRRAPVESLVGLGAREATSVKTLAETCDIIHLCLPNSNEVEGVVRGEDGILAGAQEGLIVIDTTTADPNSTLALAEEMAGQGVHLVDAPLGGTPVQAEAGQLSAMVGCEAAVFGRVESVIAAWAGTITRIGEVGSGHKMKLLMNFLAMSYASLYAEATVLGAKVGISPETFREVIAPSRLGSGFFDTFMRYAIERDRDAHKFTLANAAKDIRYVNAMATEAGVVNIMASAAKHYFAHAEALGLGQDYVPMLTDIVGSLNGLDMAELAPSNGEEDDGA